jgi:putative ABC transport system substrate-binding protein
MRYVRRREFITLLGGAAAVWPLAARAQQPAMPVIGFLNSSSPETSGHYVLAFRRGLNETGYVEGQNVAIEYRWAQGRNDQLRALADDLIRRQVAVLVAVGGSVTAQVARAATATIPIVFSGGGDPVALGIVNSLSRPDGNATSVVLMATELGTKRLELLRDLVPKATTIAALVNPSSPNAEFEIRNAQAAGRTVGAQIHIFNASTERDIDVVFANLVQRRTDALYVGSDAYFARQRAHGACSPPRSARNIRPTRVRRRGRLDQLRNAIDGNLSSTRHLHGPHSQRREAGRSPGHAANQV